MTAPTGDTPDLASIADQLSNLTALSPEELAGLETVISQAFEAADEADDLEAMSAAADALDQVQAEAASRGLDPNDPDGDGDNDASTDPGANPDAVQDTDALNASVDAETDPDTAVEDPAPAEPTAVPAAVTASTTTIPEEGGAAVDIPEEHRPLASVQINQTIVAGADVPHVSAGNTFRDASQLNQAFLDKIQAIRMAHGQGEHVLIASVQSSAPEERTLRDNDAAGNAEKIEAVLASVKQQAKSLVASGGYCAPLESRYDVFGIGETDRPVRDSLAGFQSTRGGIRFIAPPTLPQFQAASPNAVGVWTAANDASPSAPATKPFMTVTCGQEQTVSVNAVTLELQFGNFMTRAYPEMVAANNNLGLIAQARLAEQTLVSNIKAASTAVSSGFQLGTARDFLWAAARAATLYRSRHRLDPEEPLRALIPAWVKDAMREDLTWSKSTSNAELQWADSTLASILAARNINPAWYLDDASVELAQSAGNLADFPTVFDWQLFAEGTFLYLDGGVLDIGIVRDSTLVGTNDYRMFTEQFENVAKVGVESLTIHTTTHAKGSVSGDVTVS